jgi:hypothetical protein
MGFLFEYLDHDDMKLHPVIADGYIRDPADPSMMIFRQQYITPESEWREVARARTDRASITSKGPVRHH